MYSRFIVLVSLSAFSPLTCADNHRIPNHRPHHPTTLPALVRGGGFVKPTSSKGKLTKVVHKNGTSSIPAFFRTKTALQIFGFTMFSFGAPYLLAPEFMHSMLFTADLNDMSITYARFLAMREVLISLTSFLMANHPQATEGLRRWYMVFSAAILPPLQLQLLLSKQDLLVKRMKTPMQFMMVFYLFYLCFSAYLSWKCDQQPAA
jgi:hypothetical protein